MSNPIPTYPTTPVPPKPKGPSEAKAVQFPLVEYAVQIGWVDVSRKEAEAWRGFDPTGDTVREQARSASPFFDEILYRKVREFNPRYRQAIHELTRQLRQFPATIQGNREVLAYLRNERTFYSTDDHRELTLRLIDYDNPANNTYHVTTEYYAFNGHFGNRADVVFLINGLPVLVVECKNATKDEALAVSIDQLRRYERETPEMMLPPMLFTATESLGFNYGVTWNITRRNIFSWKHDKIGDLEGKTRTFFDHRQVLDFLQHYILFAEKDESLSKLILRQHQTRAVEKVVERALDPQKNRGLVWHTQGSGKTFTIIKAAQMLYRAQAANKPTILLLLDRNELEQQMERNLAMLGVEAVARVESKADLEAKLRSDFRGTLVCMVQKFGDAPASLSDRRNIYVLIDEAHRTTGGDLGTYLMAALPNATLIGFTGTPIDRTTHGKGTFVTFGGGDEQGYLDRYSIRESIEDQTTLPLFYALAPNELLVPSETLEKEFFAMAETEGITDIEELNRVLQKAVVTRTFLKAHQRVDQVARYVADHFQQNVEPLGYKAFLVGVDREACALYKRALDKYLPADYSKVVYTSGENDSLDMKYFYMSLDDEKQIRKDFANPDKQPKILIVTEKLLTGYDAPCLYCMYLDKPMRDHTLLQAIARVNRPYENEDREVRKPHGLVVDFVGIFENVQKALAFDSKEIDAIVQDVKVLKGLFAQKMEQASEQYLSLVSQPFTDKDTDALIAHFRDKAVREEFFKEYSQIQLLYEVLSPDEYLRPFLGQYELLSKIYQIVRNAFGKRVYTDKEFLRKTENLVKESVTIQNLRPVTEFFEINEQTLEQIRTGDRSDDVKIVNLIKSIQKWADDENNDLVLLSLKDKAESIRTRYEETQANTQEILDELERLVDAAIRQKEEQAAKDFDNISYFVYLLLTQKYYANPEPAARDIRDAFVAKPNWKTSERDMRELRKKVNIILLKYQTKKDVATATQITEDFFETLVRATRQQTPA